MKVMVVGGAGYIGSVVTEELICSGHNAVVFDNLVQGHREAVHPDALFIRGDMADVTALDAAFSAHGVDAVVHLAGETIVDESMTNPYRFFLKNVVHGLNLLEAMRQHGVKRLVFSSTSAVYGEPRQLPLVEDHSKNPSNAYGESKLIFERMLGWYDRAYGFRFGALRYFNAAGASERCGEHHNPENHLIPLVLQVALGQRESISIFGTDYDTPDGTCIRGYTHVVDLARAHILVLENLDRIGSRFYNVGTSRGYSVLEVIEAARKVTGVPIQAIPTDRRPGDVSQMVADASLIRQELGWMPEYDDIESIVRSAWEWHKKHPFGYNS